MGYILLQVVIAIALTDTFSYRALKPYFDRYRPCYVYSNPRLPFDKCAGFYSFPSNHAANTMAATVVCFLLVGQGLSWGFLLITLLIGLSRVYLGVHYPGDIIGGFAVGAFFGLFTVRLMRILTGGRSFYVAKWQETS